MNQESLSSITKRLKKAMADGHSGPLRIAPEVLSVLAKWDTFKDEANMSASKWVKTIEAGASIRYFQARAQAAARLGAEASRWDHCAAVWAHQQATTDKAFKTLVDEVKRQRVNAGPLTPPFGVKATSRIAHAVWGTPARPPNSGCRQCEQLKRRIAELESNQ